jgi:tRNA A-37 threonylcarbamoyl transferase component Bud32
MPNGKSPDKTALSAGRDVVFTDDRSRRLVGDRIDELSIPRDEDWEIVKRNASRTVYRGRLNGQEVYLKHFHRGDWLHRLVGRLRRCDARNELIFSEYLRQQGVPTAETLAARCNHGCQWLATRAVRPAVSCEQWHREQRHRGAQGLAEIRRGTIELARLVGRMHAAGVLHDDLHCGNVLVRTDRPAGDRMVLFDLHRATRRRRLSRRLRAKNLAQLMHDRGLWTTRTDRLRFLKAYLAASGAKGSLRGWQWLVERFAARHTRRQHRQRDRRIRGQNRYFHSLSLAGGWRGKVVLASKRRLAGSRAAHEVFERDAWRRALADPQALVDAPGAEVIKDSRSGKVVRRRLCVGDVELDVFIKQPRRKRAWKVLIDCFRLSRPMRAFRRGHQLLARRIPTALPLAALERRVGPLLRDSILITEAVDAPRLNTFLRTWLSARPRGDRELSPAQQRHLAQDVLWQLGRLVQHLHDNGYAHRDLKGNNLLVRWTPGQPPELVMIDLDGLRRLPVVPARRRFQGLMRLNVSLLECPVVNRAGRLRMLVGYLRRPGQGRINYKPYWVVLEQWSARKIRGQIRSRRRRQRAVRRPAT